MALPARKIYDDDDQESFYQEQSAGQKFGVVEGGGEGDGKPAGNLRSVKDGETGGGQTEDGAGSGGGEAAAEDKEVDNFFGNVKDGSRKEAEAFYNQNKYPKNAHKNKRVQGFMQKRFAKWALGAAGAGAVTALGAFIALLSPLQFEHFFQNINASTFIRYNAIFERRSSKWMDAYFSARMFEIDGGDPVRDNLFFRSERVDTNSPFTDWYRTMRTSSFEDDLFTKHGIRLTSGFGLNPDGSLNASRLAAITLNDLDSIDVDVRQRLADGGLDVDEIARAFNDGDNDRISQLMNSLGPDDLDQIFDIDFGDDDSARTARRRIRNIVNDEVPWYRLIRRRALRTNLRNMLGVREWRFFEGTRDTYNNHKIRFQERLINKTFGQLGGKAKLLGCLLGGSCPDSGDLAAPENQAAGRYTGSATDPDFDPDGDGLPENPDSEGYVDGDPVDSDGDGNPDSGNTADDSGRGDFSDARADAPDAPEGSVNDIFDNPEFTPSGGEPPGYLRRLIASNLFRRLNIATGLIGTLDMLTSIHNGFTSRTFTKMISLGRIAEYASVYTTYQIMSDQINSGEELTSEEAGAAFESLRDFASSEGYQELVLGREFDESSEAASCQAANRDLPEAEPYFCDDEGIGAEGTNAARVEEAYIENFAPIMGPIAAAYGGIRNLPIIGDVIDFVDRVAGVIGDAIISAALSFVGLDDEQERLMAWFQDVIGGWFGMGPILDGTEGGAKIANYIIAGGVAVSESALRYAGGAATALSGVDPSYEYALVEEYRHAEMENRSFNERWFSFDDHKSFASQSLGGVAAMSQSFSSNPLGTFFSTLKLPFIGGVAHAQSIDPAAPAEFAGMQTYSFPEQAIESNPMTQELDECTNADTVLDVVLTWDLVTNDEAFYSAVHAASDDDDVINSIWNICIMDQQIRNGYTLPYGSSEDPGDVGDYNVSAAIVGDTFDVPCATGTIDRGDEFGLGYSGGNPYRIRICELGGMLFNSTISASFLAMYNEALDQGVTLTAGQSFRTMEEQEYFYECFLTGSCNNGNRAAVPGTSNHQMGFAFDFHMSPEATEFLTSNAADYGLFAYVSDEPWHYSVTGY